eukprot:TRINITY_DN486_c0_g1_i2.p1 TRINITY_DN486_c0_g1~~TRINITY_DN486_c0_g1_i2.p1  ORF type:complete len:923 (-),score=80.98 TRINITY_DN486_c0_g1_i2:197-2965(-)
MTSSVNNLWQLCLSQPVQGKIVADPTDADRPFILEFDSLFAHAVYSSCIQKSQVPPTPVSVIAAFECFLHKLSISNKRLLVLVFKDLHDFWPYAQLRFIRTVLISHLQRITQNFDEYRLQLLQINEGQLFKSSEFLQYQQVLLNLSPSCVIYADVLTILQLGIFQNDRYSSDIHNLWSSIQIILIRVFLTGIEILNLEDIYNSSNGTFGAVHVIPQFLAIDQDHIYQIIYETSQFLQQNKLIVPKMKAVNSTLKIIQDLALTYALEDGLISQYFQKLWKLHTTCIEEFSLAQRAFSLDGDWLAIQKGIESVCIGFERALNEQCNDEVFSVLQSNEYVDQYLDVYDPMMLALLCNTHCRITILSNVFFQNVENQPVVFRQDLQLNMLKNLGEYDDIFEVVDIRQSDLEPIQALGMPYFQKSRVVKALTKAGVKWGSAERLLNRSANAENRRNPEAWVRNTDAVMGGSLRFLYEDSDDILQDLINHQKNLDNNKRIYSDKENREWKLKQQQLQAKFFGQYSSSLADGVTNRREVILVKQKQEENQPEKKKQTSKKQSKTDVRQKAQQQIEAKRREQSERRIMGYIRQASAMTDANAFDFVLKQLSQVDSEIGSEFPEIAQEIYVYFIRRYLKTLQSELKEPTVEHLDLFCMIREAVLFVLKYFTHFRPSFQLAFVLKIQEMLGVTSMKAFMISPSLHVCLPFRNARVRVASTVVAAFGKKSSTGKKDVKGQSFDVQIGKETRIPVTLGFTKSNELFVGRLAMVGFAAALIGELLTGKGALAQFGLETGIPVTDLEPLVIGLIIFNLVAALLPAKGVFVSEESEEEERPAGSLQDPSISILQPLKFFGIKGFGFTKENELFVGRVAQLGFAFALIGEAITGKGPLAQFDIETGLPLADTEPLLLAFIAFTLFAAVNEGSGRFKDE